MRLHYWLLMAGALSWSCDSVLGISPPRPREGGAGQAGTDLEPGSSGGSGSLAAGGGGAGEGEGGAGHGGVRAQGGAGTEAGGTPGNAGANGGAGEGGDDSGEGGAAGCGNVPECEPPECEEGARDCVGNLPRVCEDGQWSSGTLCQNFCNAGQCVNPPSCSGTLTCSGSVSCCRSLEVTGGSFLRDYDAVEYTDDSYPATVSSFLLDQFEVTVGRFRKFVNAYPDLGIEPGDGKAPHIEEDEGWPDGAPLPATQDDLKAQLGCDGATWMEDPLQDSERWPINCTSFFVAYAFCIWDGGRLPTEAEWNYAAAGGNEQRVYPWSVPPSDSAIASDRAHYDDPEGAPLAVGSKPLGYGRFGHAELAGNLYEWVLDTYVDPYESTECDDCLATSSTGYRSIRGGGFDSFDFDLLVAARLSLEESESRYFMGFRCARDLITTE